MKQLLLLMIRTLIILSIPTQSILYCQEAPIENKNESLLKEALTLLGKSADLHESLQYKIQCTEHLKRMVHRRRESAASFGFLPHETINARHGILIIRDAYGVPQETRVKLDRKGNVRLNRKGLPKEVDLPPEFWPIVEAYPHTQISYFTTKHQKYLNFRLLFNKDKSESQFLIECPDLYELRVEFLDRDPPIMKGTVPEIECTARASGQICLNPESGEVSLIKFYRIYPTEKGCVWDCSYPFAIIEQNVIEKTTGARFPSRVETMVPLDWRDTAIITQEFEECVFSNVRIAESFLKIKNGD